MNILHIVTSKRANSPSPAIQKLKASCKDTATCPVTIPKEELREKLTPVQYRVTQEKGTERAFSGKYLASKVEGSYRCIVCGNRMFSSDDKYNSRCGWPSFTNVLSRDSITLKDDTSHGERRVEIKCADCSAHVGHVFDDGPKPTGIRYCVNSASLDFKNETTV